MCITQCGALYVGGLAGELQWSRQCQQRFRCQSGQRIFRFNRDWVSRSMTGSIGADGILLCRDAFQWRRNRHSTRQRWAQRSDLALSGVLFARGRARTAKISAHLCGGRMDRDCSARQHFGMVREGAGLKYLQGNYRASAEYLHADGMVIGGQSPPFVGQPFAAGVNEKASGWYVEGAGASCRNGRRICVMTIWIS